MQDKTKTIKCEINKSKLKKSLFWNTLSILLGIVLILNIVNDQVELWLKLVSLALGLLFILLGLAAFLNHLSLLRNEESGISADNDGIRINISMFGSVKFLWQDIETIWINLDNITIYLLDLDKYRSKMIHIDRWYRWSGQYIFGIHGNRITIIFKYVDVKEIYQLTEFIETYIVTKYEKLNLAIH